MAAFEITYDLFKGDRDDYQELYDALENAKAVRVTESSWFLTSSSDAIKVRDWVQKYVQEKDVISVNVLAVGRGYASSNLSPEVVAWMEKNLKAQKQRSVFRG